MPPWLIWTSGFAVGLTLGLLFAAYHLANMENRVLRFIQEIRE